MNKEMRRDVNFLKDVLKTKNMTKNLKFEEIDITVTTDQEQVSGSMHTKSTVNERVQQGNGWDIKVFTRTGKLSDKGFKKLKSLLACLIWMKTDKTRKLREIKRAIEEKLWKENI
jgi:hypothetical protein